MADLPAVTPPLRGETVLNPDGTVTQKFAEYLEKVFEATENLNKDFYFEVQRGNVPGYSIVHKFGRNAAVANGSFELVSLLSGATSFLSAATTVRVKAGNTNDTAAGTGAQAITVVGIDTTLAEVSESIATAGTSASSASSASFWRVYRAYVTAASAGTYGGANTAAVTIENSGGGTDLIQIAAGEGQSQYAAYTIPTGHTAYVLSTQITVDGNKAADVKLCRRAGFNDVSTPFEPTRIMRYWDGVLGVVNFKPVTPMPALAALTDVWFEASGSGAITEVSADFELMLVQDGFS